MNINDTVAIYCNARIHPQTVTAADDHTITAGGVQFNRHNNAAIVDGRVVAKIAPWGDAQERRYQLQLRGIVRGGTQNP